MAVFSRKPLTLTVGITTCYGGESLVEAVKSVRASRGAGRFPLVIVADSVPIKPAIKTKLKQYQVKLIENKIASSQIAKQEQILKLCRTELIVFTQDDVVLAPDALTQIIRAFQVSRRTTLITIANKAMVSASRMERVIGVATDLSQKIAGNWRRGDNYLSVIGRVEALRTEFAKNKFRFPEDIVSTDAFFYLENKRAGGHYQYLTSAIVYFKNPDNLSEQLKKSSRFQYSYREMSRYFKHLRREYAIPKIAIAKGLFQQFRDSPVNTILYLGIYGYTRLLKLKPKNALNPLWEVDLSTKKV